MDFYKCKTTTIHQGHKIRTNNSICLLDAKPENKKVMVNWDNLNEIFSSFGLMVSFSFFNFKKGRRVTFYAESFAKWAWDVKEWKHPNLDIDVKVEYENINNSMSINDILNWHDAEKAIQYLKEKGLTLETSK